VRRVSGATIARMARALMRKAHLVAVVAALTLALTGCGGGDDDEAVTVATLAGTTESPSTGLPGNADSALPPGEGLPLALREQDGSGIEGIVTLLSPEGRPLVVQIQLLGGLDVPHPAHIHEGTSVSVTGSAALRVRGFRWLAVASRRLRVDGRGGRRKVVGDSASDRRPTVLYAPSPLGDRSTDSSRAGPRRKTGWSGATRRSSESGESGPTPSKNMPTSNFQRLR